MAAMQSTVFFCTKAASRSGSPMDFAGIRGWADCMTISSFQTLYKVIVPMLMPALVSCALFQFMWSCNDFMGPLLYVQTPAKYPMSLFVKLSMDGDTGFAWNRILALSLISILPQLIVFFCAQDQFVEGISAGAVKG